MNGFPYAFFGLLPDGETGQVLKKKSNASYDVEWGEGGGTLPPAGTTGQVLKKTSGDDYDTEWSDDGGGGGGASHLVYTALLNQSGGDNPLSLTTGDLVLGVTYRIVFSTGADFTNVGAPNNTIDTYFVATGTTPTSWGSDGELSYNTGAPISTVLENTLGSQVAWVYAGVGGYFGLVTNNIFAEAIKIFHHVYSQADDESVYKQFVLNWYGTDTIRIQSDVNDHVYIRVKIEVYP